MPDRKKVLITGAAGLIGGLLRNGLKDTHDVSGVDIRPVDGFTSLVADTSDLDAVLPAYHGVDTVVDLASVPDQDSPWDVVYRNNLSSTYNALEAARRAGAKRVVFASSNHATGNYEEDEPYASIVAGKVRGVGAGRLPPCNGGHADSTRRAVRNRQGVRRGSRTVLLRPLRSVGHVPSDRDVEPRGQADGAETVRDTAVASRPGSACTEMRGRARLSQVRDLLRRFQQHLAVLGHLELARADRLRAGGRRRAVEVGVSLQRPPLP